MASPSELSLDCKPHNSYSMLLKSFGDQTDQTHKLEEFLSRLEEEKLKIDAFKRELPLCMQLLTNAVEASRQQLQASRGNQGGARPVLEEFIPIKNVSACDASSDKATWMTTAQLWSQTANNDTKPNNTTNNPLTTTTSPKETDVIGFNVSANLGLDSKQRNGGAFLPFSKERNNNNLYPSPTLALSTVDKENNNMEDKKCSESSTHHENGFSCGKRDQAPGGVAMDHQGRGGGINTSTPAINTPDGQGGNIVNSNNIISGNTTTPVSTNNNNSNGSNTSNGQTHRKARRCWSPDLHRRFVNALQMLGGSQVATPKQIRELMKVDGLTNDEVKSHLQKYRLHTRRPSPSPQSAGAPTPQLVVLGSIWVPPEYAAAHGGAPTLYGAHHHHHHPASSHAGAPPLPVPPPHFCAPPQPVTQEFYAAAAPPHHPMHHHSLHQQLHHVYKAAPPQQHDHHRRSPESDDRGSSRDRSESIEDGKSDQSSSWKGESGENGGERRGLAALREDGEESNGSEITLKF